MLIIEVNKNNIDSALKKFKSKVIKTKLVSQLQDRKTYKKKSDVKRQIIKDASYKQKKKSEE
jgi:small subunit ribosomal protein S21